MHLLRLKMLQKAIGFLFGWPPPKHDPPRETAWLDGVRGTAAFLVMISHYSMEWLSPFSDAPFGAMVLKTRNHDEVWYYEEGQRLWEPWRLPILRIFMCSGDAQVAVFFVLSGFVLSWSPLASARAERHDKLAQSLGSSTVRRWFRLYLPCFVVSSIYMLHGIITNYQGLIAIVKEFWRFVRESESWANPFETTKLVQFSASNPYCFVMWTIPFEFGGSFFVYVATLGLGRIRDHRRRISAMIFVSLYAVVSVYWGYWLFGSGLVLAERVRQAGGFRKLSEKTSRLSSCIWFAVFILGLLLMGYSPPQEDWYTTPGYTWLSDLPLPDGFRGFIGIGRFWWGWGGIFTVAGACHLAFLRRFFELPIIQHLGRISFMLYLIHILLNVLITNPLRRALYGAFSTKEFREIYNGHVYITNPLMNVLVHCILWLVGIPIVMIVANFLEIYVDKPCTNFGKWLDDKLVNATPDIKLPVGEEEESLLQSAHMAGVELQEVVPR